MRHFVLICTLLLCIKSSSQELFLISESASTIPSNAVYFSGLQTFLSNPYTSKNEYGFRPEFNYGISRNLMLRATAVFRTTPTKLKNEGGIVFIKYRFYSKDDSNKHFRLALFGRYSLLSNYNVQNEPNLSEKNSRYEFGISATQLIHKTALNLSAGFETKNGLQSTTFEGNSPENNLVLYALSFGRLLYPKKYSSFKQTNVNFMVEIIGQTYLSSKQSVCSAVPVVQFIFNSQARLDLGYRQQLMNTTNLYKINGLYLNLGYVFF